jgi:hypothetical protein
MTGEGSMYSSYLHLEGPKETIPYGGDTKGEVISVGDIPISQKYSITNVLHVDPLGYNLLSVSQLSEIGFDCHFSDKGVSIIRREDSSIVLMASPTSSCWHEELGQTFER